jgi:hypothetical protein
VIEIGAGLVQCCLDLGDHCLKAARRRMAHRRLPPAFGVHVAPQVADGHRHVPDADVDAQAQSVGAIQAQYANRTTGRSGLRIRFLDQQPALRQLTHQD